MKIVLSQEIFDCIWITILCNSMPPPLTYIYNDWSLKKCRLYISYNILVRSYCGRRSECYSLYMEFIITKFLIILIRDLPLITTRKFCGILIYRSPYVTCFCNCHLVLIFIKITLKLLIFTYWNKYYKTVQFLFLRCCKAT